MLYLYYENRACPGLRLGNVQIPVVNKIFTFDRIKYITIYNTFTDFSIIHKLIN